MSLRGLWEQLKSNYAGRPQNEQRILLGLLVAVVLAMVYVGVWVPVTDYRAEVAAQVERGQAELERQARFLGTAESLHAERDALKKKVDAARKELLPGNSGTLGAAALQERANTAATEKGVTVQSTQVMKEDVLEPFRKVAIRMTLSAELKPLAELISVLEYTHHLVVPFIEISRRGAVAAGGKTPRTLQATVEVNGFVLGGDGKEGKDAKEPEAGEASPESGAAPADTLPPADDVGAEAPAVGAPSGATPPAPGATVAPDGTPPSTAVAADGVVTTTTGASSSSTLPPAGVPTTTAPAASPPATAAPAATPPKPAVPAPPPAAPAAAAPPTTAPKGNR